MDLVKIAPGVFLPGCYLQRTPVTLGQFRQFAEASGYRTSAEIAGSMKRFNAGRMEFVEGVSWRTLGDDDELPACGISWRDATAYCEWLNQTAEKPEPNGIFRLPSEAEWECACRAGQWPARGPPRLDPYAWFLNNSAGQPHPVGQKLANPWGLLDMLGNVAEWTRDVFEPKTGDNIMILKGGSWAAPAQKTRPSTKGRGAPEASTDYSGFRVCFGPSNS